MSPLTIWHYLLIMIVVLFIILTIVSIIITKPKYKYSIFTTAASIILFIAFFMWGSINENVYIVSVSNLKQERLYQSEQILIKGVVTNSGKYPVANIVATVKLSNVHSQTTQNTLFSQPSVFKEIYKGDNPDFKVQNVVEKHIIADHLAPAHSKPFKIMMKFPSHFKNSAFEVEAKASY